MSEATHIPGINRLVAATRTRVLVGFALGAVATPFVVGIGSLLQHLDDRFRPWGDQALMDLSVRAIGSHAVLLGPYSRFGWRHPGPLYFDLLVVPYRILGGSYAALSVGAVLITGAAALGIVLVSARRGGQGLALWAAAVVLVFLGSAGGLAADPWNPWVTMVPFAFAVMLAWTLACGDLWALPLLAFVATFLVQTHVGYAGATGLVTIAALGVVIRQSWQQRADLDRWPDRRRRWTRVGLLTGGVLIVLWLQPLIDLIVHFPGNLWRMLAFLGSGGSDQTVGDALERVAQYLGAIPARLVDGATLFDSSSRSVASWPAIVSVSALVAASGLALWRRARSALIATAIVGLALVGAVLSLSRVVGDLEEYLVDWTAAIGIPLWIAVGAAAMTAFPDRARVRSRRGVASTAALIACASVVVLAVEVLPGFHLGGPDPTTVTATRMTDAVRSRLPGRPAPVVIRLRDPLLTPWAAGILNGLRADGVDATVQRGVFVNESFWPWEVSRRPHPGDVVVTLARANDTDAVDAVVEDVTIDVTRKGPLKTTTTSSAPITR